MILWPSAILVTDSELLGNAVAAELEMQLAALPRQEIAALSLANHGKIIIASDMETVIEMANISAPEHLEVMTKEPFALLPYLRNAGAIFFGRLFTGAFGRLLCRTEPHSAYRPALPFLLSSECGDVYEENKYHCLYAGRLD